MIYLGTPGRMIGIKCPASQQVQAAERHGFVTTMEGRVKSMIRPLGRRVWNLSTSDATTPAEASALHQFASGAWGAGPFIFVSADAPNTNLLSPDAANSMVKATSGVSSGGPVQAADGTWSAQSLLANGAGTMYFDSIRYPVSPDKKISFSADVVGAGAKVLVVFYDAAGGFLSSATSSSAGASGVMSRLTITATPPVGAATVQVGMTSGVQATRPTLTWLGGASEWAAGEGCPKAVVHGMSRDLKMAVPGSTYSSISFTVTEVG